MTTTAGYQASAHLLAQARQELADGDLPQASEKSWGATTQILKAITAQRGWEHSRHLHCHRIISRLRAETGDGEIRRLFNTASALHENFYQNDMQIGDVADGPDDVEGLLGKLLTTLTQTCSFADREQLTQQSQPMSSGTLASSGIR